MSNKIFGFRVAHLEFEVNKIGHGSILKNDNNDDHDIMELENDPKDDQIYLPKNDLPIDVNTLGGLTELKNGESIKESFAKYQKDIKRHLENPSSILKSSYGSKYFDPFFENVTSKIDNGGYAGFLMNFLKSDSSGIFVTSSSQTANRFLDFEIEEEKMVEAELTLEFKEIAELKSSFKFLSFSNSFRPFFQSLNETVVSKEQSKC